MPEPTPIRAVTLLSGGLDSAVTLAEALRAGRACVTLSIAYGQRHRAELDAAAALSAQLGATRHVTLSVDLRGAVGGSALTAEIPVPKDRDPAEIAAQAQDAPAPGSAPGEVSSASIPVTYVPARNLIFLSCAAGLAEAEGAQEIYIGTNTVDYSGYPDCRPGFLEAFERCATLGTKTGVTGAPIRVVAPLSRLTKAQIVRRGVELGVDLGATISCYDPQEGVFGGVSQRGFACGRCDACLLRRRGFQEAGVQDPTRYASAG